MTTSTNTTRKPTQRDRYAEIREILASAGRDDLVEFVDGRVAQLDKKNSAERKPTAKQVENAGFKQEILSYMEQGMQYTSADITKGVPALVEAGVSANRVTAMLTQLVNDGAVVKTVDKRKSYYSLA